MKATPVAMILAGLLIAAAAGPSVRAKADADRKRAFEGLTTYEIEKRNTNPFAVIMGEMRTSAADLMYVKTERYIHSGVGYTPHLSTEEMARSGAVTTGTADESGGSTTIIPTVRDDFRGPIGDLERAVKPYVDPSKEHMAHIGGEEVLPWFRVMTAADPHFIRGYRIGAMWLINTRKWDQAYDFIQEGIRYNEGNPEQFRLYTSLITYYIKTWTVRDSHQGNDWVEPALKAARTAYRLGLAERPPLGEEGAMGKHVVWTTDLEEDFLSAARYVPIFLRRLGRNDEALQFARQAVKQAPTDGPLSEILRDLEAEAAPAN
ncbi:hypothetical protein KQI84_17990 [bacterium]|nr:hypothetical protein [bacterium]